MEYRLFFLHPLDKGMGYLPVLKKDDSAAIAAARKIAVRRPFELWSGRRLVFRKDDRGQGISTHDAKPSLRGKLGAPEQ